MGESPMETIRFFAIFDRIGPRFPVGPIKNGVKAILHRDKIYAYCLKGLSEMGQAYESLDASRPWLVYWTVHALDLLDYDLPDDRKTEICEVCFEKIRVKKQSFW